MSRAAEALSFITKVINCFLPLPTMSFRSCLFRLPSSGSYAAGVLLWALLGGPAQAALSPTQAQAQRYLQDAQQRLERSDAAGAVIQARNALQQDTGMLAARILLARALLRDGQIPAAQAEFERALEAGARLEEVAQPYGNSLLLFGKSERLLERIRPTGLKPAAQAEIFALRAAAHADLGDMKAAFKAVEDGRQLDPAALAPVRTEIELALRVGESARARRALDAALRLAPRDPHLIHLQGAFRQSDGDAKGAMSLYAQALALDPNLIDARIARGALSIDMGRLEDALPDLDKAASQDPQEPRVAYLRSLIHLARGDAKASRAELEKVARLVDALPESFLSRQPSLLMLGALASQSLGRMERARALLEQYVLRLPNDPAGRKLLASIYMISGDTSRVADLLDPLLRSGESDVQVLTTLAALRLQQRRYREATEALEQAARKSGDPGIRAQIGFLHLATQQTDLGFAALRAAFDRQPAQPNVASALATLYLRRGDGKSALAVVDTLVRRMPNEPVVHNLQGAIRAALGRMDEARPAYQRALDLLPSYTPARLNMARLELSMGQTDEARKRLRALMRDEPRNFQPAMELARLERKAGRPLEALPLAEQARRMAPDDIPAGMELLATYEALGQLGAAIDVARKLEQQRPDDPVVLDALARCALTVRDGLLARGALAKMARMAGSDPERLLAIGRMQLLAGAANDAGASAEKALAVKPGLLEARVLQIDAEVLAGNLPRAESLLKQLPSRAGQAEVLRIGGDLAMARNRPVDAIRAYQSALAQAPATSLALRAYQAAFRAGMGEKGVAQLEDWLARHADDVVVRSALAEGYLRLGQLPKARSAYEAVLKQEPRNVAVMNNLAQVLMQLNEPKAVALAEQAAGLAPGDPNVLDTVGWLQVRRGDLDVGLARLKEARERAPGARDIRYHLAWALARKGLKEEARAELASAFRGSGEFENEPDARRLRQELGG